MILHSVIRRSLNHLAMIGLLLAGVMITVWLMVMP